MAAIKKNILILSYFFPPCNKVGGRRWAKFAKYLYRRGFNIYVVSVNVPFSGQCPWEKDTESYRQNITRLPYIEHRPYYRVNKSPAGIAGKIRYRLSLYREKLFPPARKGDNTDISYRYKNSLQNTAAKIIREKNIHNVIVTGGPFQWCHDGMALKKNFPGVKFFLDLRDFWTGGELYKRLSRQNKAAEDEKENFCIETGDAVFTPAERIRDFLHSKYVLHTKKINVLSHAFDADEFPKITTGQNLSDPDKISMAYAGILYSKMEKAIEQLIALIQHLKAKQIEIKLDLYTFDRQYIDMFKTVGLDNNISYHPTLPADKLFKILLEKDYLLQLRAGESEEQHFKSTKFYELIALRKPIIYFGPHGDISDFLVKNELGFNGGEEVSSLADRIVKNKIQPVIPNRNFDVSNYEFEKVATDLEKFL